MKFANVNAKDNSGNTPLHLITTDMAVNNRKQKAEILLSNDVYKYILTHRVSYLVNLTFKFIKDQ